MYHICKDRSCKFDTEYSLFYDLLLTESNWLENEVNIIEDKLSSNITTTLVSGDFPIPSKKEIREIGKTLFLNHYFDNSSQWDQIISLLKPLSHFWELRIDNFQKGYKIGSINV